MAVIEGGVSGLLQEVGLGAAVPAHVTLKPLPHGALGHYRVAVRFSLIAAQAANSRLFELRNTATNLIVLTRLVIKWAPTAAHTAAILDSLDVFRLTGFTAVDTTNTVTPVPSVKRTAGMAAAPGGAAIRNVTIAGAAAGMTGGTLTKDANAISIIPQWLLATQPTAGPAPQVIYDVNDPNVIDHPFVFAQNEGFEIENRVLLGAAAGSEVVVECDYAEVTLF
jgi:hypothetical protein